MSEQESADRQQASRFKRFLEGWKKFGRKVGDFQARLILTLFYFLILAPFAVLLRIFGDPLAIKRATAKGWLEPKKTHLSPKEAALKEF